MWPHVLHSALQHSCSYALLQALLLVCFVRAMFGDVLTCAAYPVQGMLASHCFDVCRISYAGHVGAALVNGQEVWRVVM